MAAIKTMTILLGVAGFALTGILIFLLHLLPKLREVAWEWNLYKQITLVVQKRKAQRELDGMLDTTVWPVTGTKE
jgi:hypothetical protein